MCIKCELQRRNFNIEFAHMFNHDYITKWELFGSNVSTMTFIGLIYTLKKIELINTHV